MTGPCSTVSLLAPPAPRALASGLIVTRTPLRISLAGGGTDLPGFYEKQYGAVLSTAIDKYVYVTLKRHDEMFGAPIRLNYSETEEVTTVEEIRNQIARECFRFLDVRPPIYMSTVADIPAASGLGSSSAFAVGLLNALHAYRGEAVSAGQLAEEAAHIEIDILGRPIGKQDHYAAAFGGFNFFRFLPTGGVSVEPQQFTGGGPAQLLSKAMMFWTGITRNAAEVLTEQSRNTAEKMTELLLLREHAHQLHYLLGAGCEPHETGRVLDACWRLKRNLASVISNSRIDEWYRRAMEAGAWGGKLCGAGGGGFLLFLVPAERREAVRAALPDLQEVSIRCEPQGSRVLMPHVE
ncbi:MAG: GHMP kinase [Acidimicrobiia bacterium]|nr:GHMP kinase [Acidimicrobiia bacterium]